MLQLTSVSLIISHIIRFYAATLAATKFGTYCFVSYKILMVCQW